jgi:putative endonuclease
VCTEGNNVTENITETAPAWYVYLIRTRTGSLYAGITTDTERRLKEHHGARKGAKHLRGKGPLELVYREQFANRSVASKLEARIKKLSRLQKEALITGALHWSEITGCAQV